MNSPPCPDSRKERLIRTRAFFFPLRAARVGRPRLRLDEAKSSVAVPPPAICMESHWSNFSYRYQETILEADDACAGAFTRTPFLFTLIIFDIIGHSFPIVCLGRRFRPARILMICSCRHARALSSIWLRDKWMAWMHAVMQTCNLARMRPRVRCSQVNYLLLGRGIAYNHRFYVYSWGTSFFPRQGGDLQSDPSKWDLTP